MSIANHTLLDFYKAIENTSALMLSAAQVHDWDEVVRLEGACAMLIEQLRERSEGVELNDTERQEKQRIMLTILKHDAQMRTLAEPWIDVLGGYMQEQRPMHLH
jgi:flagellar protein FliT